MDFDKGGDTMEEFSQEYVLSIVFRNAIDKEELLLKKYEEYYSNIKNKELKEVIKEFKKTSREHLKVMKDKMIKLKIQ
jgi:rubrerythrin